MRSLAFVVSMLMTSAAVAQESRIASDWRREKESIAENCSVFDFKKVASCAVTLATDYPFHVALGNLPPQNGFAFGLAFVERFTPNEKWRISWNADVVGAPSGSWRGGAYVKFIHTDVSAPKVVTAGGAAPASSGGIHEYPVFNIYAQKLSADTIFFFGPGQPAEQSTQSAFGESQTIVGGNAIVPLENGRILRMLKTSVIGAINGRFVDIRPDHSGSVPSIEEIYDDASAPGLNHQPGFVEFLEGARFKPSTPNGWLRLNYLVQFQQFLTSSEPDFSFHRLTFDLRHEIPLYHTVTSSGPRDTNGPDECSVGVGNSACPPLTYSRNLSGSVGLRLLTVASSAFAGSRVPFYFQPTMGGSDINGQRLLASFDDYRFRGPNLIAIQETFEHSIWGPLGAYFAAEQGNVTPQGSGLSLSDLTHSFSLGISIRAGGLPVANVTFAWGPSGHHLIATMDASLAGGSSRPSLY